ncbi:MAG: biotin/lipoyl-binding protein [Phycisphaerae bacterium]|nr:biotin/lipoyl-binding protein [Phycisphaerae bacterium]
MNERPTFSPLWHRVRALKPRLRPHVQITRQHYRGRRWHVVHDPSSNQFYRLSPVAHEFVGLLDGNRSVEEVWNISLGTHGDHAPTQHEVIELLGQLYNSNLLALDASPETEQLLSRGRERVKRRITQQAIGIMYFKIRLFNPDRILAWIEPILRPLINRWGLLLWVLWVGYGIASVVPHWDSLMASYRDVMAPANWLALAVSFVVVKAIHELGHGVICRRFGGHVPEFGFMLLVMFPSPYVDASATWAFPSKYRRMAVGAGGMLFELAVAAAAALVWIDSLSGGSALVRQLAFNAMFTASVSTILFNANPLMRFDGYYILSDLIEVPNLMQRSGKMLQHLVQRFVLRLESSRSPSNSPAERAILIVYGIASMAYRIFLFFAITLYVMGQFFGLGVFLAAWTAAAWFILPAGKLVHWLATSPQLGEKRKRSIALLGSSVLASALLLGAVPFPDHRRASGVVESLSRTGVAFGTDGFIVAAHVRPGDAVRAGDPLVTLESADLTARLREAQGQLVEYESRERQYSALPDTEGIAISLRQHVGSLRGLIDEVNRRIAELVVRAPHDGVVVVGVAGSDPQTLVGMFVRRGQLLCEVVDTTRVRVAAPLDSAKAQALLLAGPGRTGVRLRPLSEPDTLLTAAAFRLRPAGDRLLPHPSLGFAGGGAIETEPADRLGLASKTPRFTLEAEDVHPVDAPKSPWAALPGERVALRFTLPARPLLDQWIQRLRQIIQERVHL